MASLILLTGWLASRLVLLFYDVRLPVTQLAGLGAVQALWSFLVLGFSWAALVVAAGLVVLLVIQEKAGPDGWLNAMRLVVLLMVLSVLTIARHRLGAHPVQVELWILATIGKTALWFLFGLLLVANEANFAIRSLFHVSGVEPRSPSAPDGGIDQREYNAGRIIGILERWLMYIVLVISHNYTIIAIVIAAKGFARFKALDDREFAEYVLIGTLASTLITVVIAEAVVVLMG